VFIPWRQVSLGSISAAIAVVIAKFFFGGGLNGQSFELTLFVVGIAVLFIVTHRENIKRIRSGTENKI
jgi:glycerol-3-phosphate acyltransferase PlsY